MKVYLYLLIGVFVCLSHFCEGKGNVFTDDSEWYINFSYAPVERDTFKLKLNIDKLPDSLLVQGYRYVEVVWEDGVSGTGFEGPVDISSAGTTFEHKYLTGKYTLLIRYCENNPSTTGKVKLVHKVVYNQRLQGDIVIEGKNDGCMEHGVDTFLVRMDKHKDNPPGTEYTVKVRSDLEDGGDFWKIIPVKVGVKDSMKVIFTGPTGTFGAEIRFDMVYKDESNPLNKLKNETVYRTVHVYKTPDLSEMFHFKDTLDKTETEVTDIEVCSGRPLAEITYDSVRNQKYMFSDELPSYADRRWFTVEYFRKDTAREDVPWINVTKDSSMVDTTKMIFKYPGFYKIRMVAQNFCGADSLHTDVVIGNPTKKYIQVYQNSSNNFYCGLDTLCITGSALVPVVIVDRGKRFDWDPMPNYVLTVIRTFEGKQDTIEQEPNLKIYKNNLVITDDNQGCDSVSIGVTLNAPGTYDLVLVKGTRCTPDPPGIRFKHKIVIGRVPLLPLDTLWKALEGTVGEPVNLCDTFKYKLPELLISENNFSVDSIRWVFQRGSRTDTIYREGSDEKIIVFDSLGDQLNKMYVEARNFCGWSGKENVEFYTRTQPNVVLLRDGIEKNDTLCAGLDYPYHFGGILPDDYDVMMTFTERATVDGVTYNANQNATLSSTNSPLGKVLYDSEGKVYETFKISNRNLTTCKQILLDSVVLVKQPDNIIYDTVRHCEDYLQVDGEDLFGAGNKNFKAIEWELNRVALSGNFPDFPVAPDKNDTLKVKTSNGGGCHIVKEAIFKPVVRPEFTLLADETMVCKDTSLFGPDYLSYVGNNNIGTATGVTLSVYADVKNNLPLLVYDTLNSELVTKRELQLKKTSPDSVRLIYHLKNRLVTGNFGNCEYKDTLLILVKKPAVEIVGRDTLREPFLIYDFASFRGSIDTADIIKSSLEWTAFNPTSSQANFSARDVLRPKYTLTSGDLGQDSLKFVLSANSPCGETVSDTLIVRLSKYEVFAYTDTICSTEPGHLMWGTGRAHGNYVDENTLEWRIVNVPSADLGQIIPATGKSAKYIPNSNAAGVDSVKIEITGHYLYNNSKTTKDTIFLKVNPSPVSTYKDTLLVALHESPLFEISKIHSDNGGVANIKSWEWKNVTSGDGSWTNSTDRSTATYMFDNAKYAAGNNYATKVFVELKGLKGCNAVVRDTIVLYGINQANITRLNSFDLCDGDSIKLSGSYTIPAFDKYTALVWSKVQGTGHFNAGFTHYVAGVNDDITSITLQASKTFADYKQNVPVKRNGNTKTGSVTVYQEPFITLKRPGIGGGVYEFDTLCVNDQIFHYEAAWVDCNYDKSFLRTNESQGFSGYVNFSDFAMTNGVNQAKLIVTVDLGECKKWANKGDTISITRLSPMSGSFSVSDICEGGTLRISDATYSAQARKVVWKSIGGTLDDPLSRTPLFTSSGSGQGTIKMGVIPVAEKCKDTVWVERTFNMMKKPALALKDSTICENVSSFRLDFVKPENIQYIDWYVNGEATAFDRTNSSESAVDYFIKSADRNRGSFSLVAKIKPLLPCVDEIVSAPMVVTLRKMPSFVMSDQDVCQGDTLKLGHVVVGSDYSTLLWTATAGAFIDPASPDAQYLPGENTGEQILTVTAQGMNGCGQAQSLMVVRISPAVKPVFAFDESPCLDSEIIFRNKQAQGAGANALWKIDGVEMSDHWYNFGHTFNATGNYDVSLTVSYNNACVRTEKKRVTIYGLPQTEFISDSIVGVGKEIAFTNTTPGTINSYSWEFDHGNLVSDLNGIRKQRYDFSGSGFVFSGVKLTVENEHGCKASKKHTVKVVGLPLAQFGFAQFDKCTGATAFNNMSAGEDLSFYWNLGDGAAVSLDTVPKNIVFRPVYRDTTYRILLTVKNAAGETTMLDSVKVISKLETNFFVSPDKEGCEGRQMDKVLSNRSRGQANQYIFEWGDGTSNQMFPDFYNVSHAFRNNTNAVQHYTVKVTANNICNSSSAEKVMTIYPNVVEAAISLNVDRGCFPLNVGFTNESSGFGSDANTWWYFDNNILPEHDNNKVVNKRFNKPGAYYVKIAMTDRCNTDTSDYQIINVLGDQSLAFGIAEGPYCSMQKIEMKMLPGAKNKFTNLTWQYGDGYTDVGVDSIMKRYLNAGTYQVRLSGNSISEGNCPFTTPVTEIKVNSTPYAAITPIEELTGCAPYTVVKFVRAGTGNEQAFWDFRNGATSTESLVQNVSFPEPGKYNVLLRLKSPEGCVDTANKLVTVKETPRPDFDVSDSLFCTVDGNISIDLFNKTLSPELSSFEWSHNNKLPFSRLENPDPLQVSQFDTIKIKLVATNKVTTCAAQFLRNVYSSHNVIAAMEADTAICDGAPITFKNISQYSSKAEWDLGDGTNMTDAHFTYTYGEPGEYPVKLVAKNEGACTDTLKKRITVYPLPVAAFSHAMDNNVVDKGYPDGFDFNKLPEVSNGGIKFTNQSTIDNYAFADPTLKYLWDFGDNTGLVSGQDVTHRFKNNGEYLVKLKVSTFYGCVDSITDQVYLSVVKGLFMPNAFAPATQVDGTDRFQPKGIGLAAYKIQVYDYKSGICVWSSDKLVDGRPGEYWDGIFNGAPAPGGTYLWKASAVFLDGSVWEGENGKTQGFLRLIR